MQHEIEIRVRYQETDGQGRVHHANYLTWFELGRVELLRAMGHSYRELEQVGIYIVVAEAALRYHLPAFFDDVLQLRTTAVRRQKAIASSIAMRSFAATSYWRKVQLL